MPHRNRVDPCGAIFASAARGTLMGNRGGVMHDDGQQIVRQYAGRRWIACLLEFKGRRRVVMTPNRYTELFFLDEAVALAAGHRPCAECRRARFNAFKAAWLSAELPHGGRFLLAGEMDTELHRTRIDRERRHITWEASLSTLPDGCFIHWEGGNYLVWGDALCLWSPEGYVAKRARQQLAAVTVVTPEPMVRCLRQGYEPDIHPSALALIRPASRPTSPRADAD
jgi:hypothetical protein